MEIIPCFNSDPQSYKANHNERVINYFTFVFYLHKEQLLEHRPIGSRGREWPLKRPPTKSIQSWDRNRSFYWPNSETRRRRRRRRRRRKYRSKF